MLFSVIYEVDCGMDDRIGRYLPSQRNLFDMTERGDGEPSDWCAELFDGKCKHRKLCGVLSRKQFERFLDDTGLFAENVRTGGSIGAPGCGFGIAPAISFRNDDPLAIQSAYVTPLPNKVRESAFPMAENRWERIRAAVIRRYS